jgi:serine protease Do
MKQYECPVTVPYGTAESIGSAVVQIVSQVSEFDWLEPYRAAEQGERRGSGFFINRDGYIITNMHVVDQAKSVWVHIPMLGRHMVPAAVVGICPDRDIALVRIDTRALAALKILSGDAPSLTLGDSDLLRQGEVITAFGYPLGDHRLKVSPGVVSGFEGVNGQSLIQITSPINRGNSGGPLVDAQGNVVGIVVAKQTEAYNIGYALPINEVPLILEELYTQGLVRKPVLGALFVYSNDQKAAYLGNPMPAGVYISRVMPDSLFERIGVQEGDMLYEFNGFSIDAYGETIAPWGAERVSLYDHCSRLKRGQLVPLVIYRRGERKEFSLVFDTTALPTMRIMYPDFEEVDYEVFAGLVVMELTLNHMSLLFEDAPELVAYQQVQHIFEHRLIITHIIPGSLAQQARFLTIGDEFVMLNGKRVTTIKQLRNALSLSISTGFVAFLTKRAAMSAFSLKEVLQDEVRLSVDYAYPISPLMRRLIKKLKIIVEK